MTELTKQTDANKKNPSKTRKKDKKIVKKKKLTPMMQQYMGVKTQHPNSIVFFRMGDFFEMFFEDAILASKVLEITQTYRNKMDDNPIPMAGIPHHAYKGYVNRFVEAGYTVVICDQVEDAKLAKGIVVKREVTRIVTPGMVLDPDTLDARSNHYLVALCLGKKKHGISSLDLTTGEFRVTEVLENELLAELQRIHPRELLLSEEQHQSERFQSLLPYFENTAISQRENRHFTLRNAREGLLNHFEMISLEGFGISQMDTGIRAAGAIIEYVQDTQKTKLNHIISLRPYLLQEFMLIDEETKVNLELLFNIKERKRKGSLFNLLDRSITAMGGRKIKSWMLYPLLSKGRIDRRHDAVGLFFESSTTREDLRTHLKLVHDLERLNGKVASGIASPRDLVMLRRSLEMIPLLLQTLESLPNFEEKLGSLSKMDPLVKVAKEIQKVLNDEPPLLLKDGGLIRQGYHQELDIQRDLAANSKDRLLQMEQDERKFTGIKSLKIKFNRIFGYYIEVTKPNLHLVPEDRYLAKQTMVNHVRYINEDLKEFERKILGAEEKSLLLEEQLFYELRMNVMEASEEIAQLADQVAQLDALCAFAELAVQNDYTRPKVVEEPILLVTEGRHPVVEELMRSGEFVPNDIDLQYEEKNFILITGPNMAGKSTIMRQMALLALMAQIGSFVPAQEATIGICDRIFTRVGASDNLVAGQSTFMVEMTETANILHNATSRSLVILDEIGRGTSTFDGISIAWAVVEYLHNKQGCRTLFATHYHELTMLEQALERFKNMNVVIREWNDQIVFVHKLEEGGSDQSYGIEVGRLAGLPKRVVNRARKILQGLEEGNLPTRDKLENLYNRDSTAQQNQMALFVPAHSVEIPPLQEELQDLELNNLTPFQALQILHEWKEKWGSEPSS